MRLAFTLSKASPKNRAARVHWWAQVAGRQINGRDVTVFDAVQNIENQLFKLEARDREKSV